MTSWVHWGPRSAPYECLKHAEWPKHLTIQPHCSKPSKEANFPIQHDNIHQSVQLNKLSKMHTLRPSEHSWQPSQQCSQPKIITWKEQIKELYADVSEGIGCFPSQPYHINLDQSVTPVQTRCRPVPVHLKEVFKQEINKMLDAGILQPVEKATPWINSFVLVKGKNPDGSIKLRICLDPANLNKDSDLWTLLQQDSWGHCTSFSKCKGYYCQTVPKDFGMKS